MRYTQGALLRSCAAHCRKETVFFDTCSVKVLPALWMQTWLPEGSEMLITTVLGDYKEVDGRIFAHSL